MTQKLSKDEILALYLNQINYGGMAYGIEAASQTYFGKPAKDLLLPECAMLSTQSPCQSSRYSGGSGTGVRVHKCRPLHEGSVEYKKQTGYIVNSADCSSATAACNMDAGGTATA